MINAGDAASTGVGFQIPKTLKPGDYTVEISIASPNRTEWDTFDTTSLPITIEENRQAQIDKVDLTYESGVIQGYLTVENDGNLKLDEGDVRIAVIDGDTEQRVRVENIETGQIAIGDEVRKTVNFNFSAEKNSTYYLGLEYDDGNTTDSTFTQIATGPRPSMEVVDIDGPEEVIQGDNATYTVVLKNNGEVAVDSTSLTAELQTGQGTVVNSTGVVAEVVSPGKEQTVKVTFAVDDPALLGRSKVSVTGQAHTNNSTTTMLPREEDIFVSAPGFIISGDSSFSGLSPGESFTVTETFLVVGQANAVIDVELQYDTSKVELISGTDTQTVTSGSSISWTFLVKDPVNGRPITILAESNNQARSKDIGVATIGSTGLIGSFDDGLPDSYEEFFPNTYAAAILPGFDTGVYYQYFTTPET